MWTDTSLLHDCPTPEETLRRFALSIPFFSGAGLVEVLRRIAGEDGLALGFAFRDMVMDPQMTPTAWPVGDVLALLDSAGPARGRQAAPLKALLFKLVAQIDAWSEGVEVNEADFEAESARRAA